MDVMQNWDLHTLMWVRSFQTPLLAVFATVASLIAWKGLTWWMLSTVLWLRGRRAFALELGLALVLAVISGLPLKGIICRPRPGLYASQAFGQPAPELLLTAHSFPSGHTLMAATAAFVITFYCRPIWSILAWSLVIIIGIARVHGGYHWPTDVIGSIALGLACAFVARLLCKLPIAGKLEALPFPPLKKQPEPATAKQRDLVSSNK